MIITADNGKIYISQVFKDIFPLSAVIIIIYALDLLSRTFIHTNEISVTPIQPSAAVNNGSKIFNTAFATFV
jgi:hypothetical protein